MPFGVLSPIPAMAVERIFRFQVSRTGRLPCAVYTVRVPDAQNGSPEILASELPSSVSALRAVAL